MFEKACGIDPVCWWLTNKIYLFDRQSKFKEIEIARGCVEIRGKIGCRVLPDDLQAFGRVFADVLIDSNERATLMERLPNKRPVERILMMIR